MQNLFQNEYQTRKLLSEIQILRVLSRIPHNCFTSGLKDVVYSVEHDFIFMVLEYMESDLKKVLNSSVKIIFASISSIFVELSLRKYISIHNLIKVASPRAR